MVWGEPQSFGRVLSSMCTPPHPAAKEAAIEFLETNPGDPETYPTVAAIEHETVEWLGEIAGHPDAAGYIATGGTEANIQALRVARELSSTGCPNVVLPESGHFSFDKAGSLLGVEVRRTALGDDQRADVGSMARAIDENTVMLVAVGGTTEYGRVDPIPAIGELAREHDILCHVDAAFGGFALPFADRPWHFGDAPIDTLTIDPHKLGRAAIPAGGFLCRSPELLELLEVETPYLESGTQVTLGGTRSGAGVASAHAAIDALWPNGYRAQYERATENASMLVTELRDRDFHVVEPELPIVAVELPELVFSALRSRGWRLSRTQTGETRVVCMPHVTREQLASFLADIDRARHEPRDHHG